MPSELKIINYLGIESNENKLIQQYCNKKTYIVEVFKEQGQQLHHGRHRFPLQHAERRVFDRHSKGLQEGVFIGAIKLYPLFEGTFRSS